MNSSISAFSLAWRTLLRDWRAGDMRLLVVAVAIAVGALTAVAFLADRMQAGLVRDAAQLLGGDVVVSSDKPTPPEVLAEAAKRGLKTSTSLAFPTMARAKTEQGGAAKLVALKAVDGNYPLRGSLRTSDAWPIATDLEVSSGQPASGTVWLDGALLDSLSLKVGDELLLGDSRLKIAKVISSEPDRGAGFMNFAPRVLVNEADLPATALVQPASRLTYRFAAVGDKAATSGFTNWVQARLPIQPRVNGERQTRPAASEPQTTDNAALLRGVRLESLQSGRPEMQQTLDRAGKFLRLVALLAALLSAVAIAIAARGFASRHLDGCAMLRVLGCSQNTLAAAYALEFLMAGVFASLLGVALGWGLHHALLAALAGLVDASLPAPSLAPAALGVGLGLVLLIAFGLPPVLQLARVPALRVLRRDLGQIKASSLAVLGLGLAGFGTMLMMASGDLKLGGIAVGGFALAALVFAGVAYLAVRTLRASVREETAPRWLVLATRQLAARPSFAVLQVSALAVGLLALALLVLLRTDLIKSWRQSTPPDAPNRFVINLQPDQAAPFKTQIESAGVKKYDLFPMIRGRLIAINGTETSPDKFTDDRAKRLVDREFNLSNAANLPDHNKIIAGAWTPEEAGGISVEKGIADTLNLKLGDTLKFDVGGMPVEAKITSLREVDWASMRANFFVMFPVSNLENVPATYMSALRAPSGLNIQDAAKFDNQLSQNFPNVTVVDMSQTIAQVQRVLDQVIRAIEFLFGFTLLAGLIVLWATVSATREERAKEYAVLRAIGARSSLLRTVQRAELLGVGFLAGALAGIVAMGMGWGLAKVAFEFNWTVSYWTPLATGLAGALLAWAAGYFGLRGVLNRPVMMSLREAV